jgi:hypothetical protein
VEEYGFHVFSIRKSAFGNFQAVRTMKAQILTKFSVSALSVAAICCAVSVGFAADPPNLEQLPPVGSDGPIVIYRKVYPNESLSELGSRLYDKVDYELKLRELTRDIRVAEAELQLHRERMQAYDKFFGYPDAGWVTLQNAKLDVLKSEEQLKLLRRAKLLALRHRNDQVRYRERLLAEGAARLQLTE